MMQVLYSSFYRCRVKKKVCIKGKSASCSDQIDFNTPDVVIYIYYFFIIIIINAKVPKIEVQKISTLCTKKVNFVNTKLKL